MEGEHSVMMCQFVQGAFRIVEDSSTQAVNNFQWLWTA